MDPMGYYLYHSLSICPIVRTCFLLDVFGCIWGMAMVIHPIMESWRWDLVSNGMHDLYTSIYIYICILLRILHIYTYIIYTHWVSFLCLCAKFIAQSSVKPCRSTLASVHPFLRCSTWATWGWSEDGILQHRWIPCCHGISMDSDGFLASGCDCSGSTWHKQEQRLNRTWSLAANLAISLGAI